MGNYANKLLFRVHENQRENNETDSNVQTPKLLQRKLLSDPRSISVGITRTPIEVKDTPPLTTTKRIPSAIPRHLQTKQFLETNLDVIMPPLSPKKPRIPRSITRNLPSDERHDDYSSPKTNVAKGKKSKLTPIDKERYRILGLDPRSPAADFERTPILVSKSLALIKARSQENLNRKGSYETDVYNPDSPGNLQISLSRSIPELLSSVVSEIRTKLNLGQPNESDTIKSESSSDESEVFESEEEEITVINNPKFKARQEASSISSEQTIDERRNTKSDNYEDTEGNTKTTRSTSDSEIKVWHDSSSSERELSGKKVIENIIEKSPRGKISREEIIITFDECIKISTSVKTIKAEGCHKAGEVEDGKSITLDVKFTSSEKKTLTPEKKCGTEISMHRTPLGNRSNNDKKMILNSTQRSRNKIYNRIQQENTPPSKNYKKYNAKTKSGNQWEFDPNTTVFI